PVLFLAIVIFQDIHRPIAELEEVRIGGEIETEEGELAVVPIPPEIAVWHIRDAMGGQGGAGESEPGRKRRLQGLASWLRSLPDEKRVLLLDLTGADHFDADSLAALARACRELHAT